MPSFNAILTLERQHNGADLADEVHGSALDAYHAVTGADDRGRAQIIITLTAENLAQATITTRAVLSQFTDQARLDVMTTTEYDRADAPIPELVSVTEAAQRLGVTRQAILSRISYGTLPARRIGREYAIPAASTRKETQS